MIYIWDLVKPEIMFQFEFPDSDQFLSVGFNYDGSKLVVSNKEPGVKDGLIHVLDVREGEIVAVSTIHHHLRIFMISHLGLILSRRCFNLLGRGRFSFLCR